VKVKSLLETKRFNLVNGVNIAERIANAAATSETVTAQSTR
jgi:hypothetical protein